MSTHSDRADAAFEAELAAAYDKDPDAFDTDWRCEDCRCLNRGHESFCFRCGAGQPEDGARPVEPLPRVRIARSLLASGVSVQCLRTACFFDDRPSSVG